MNDLDRVHFQNSPLVEVMCDVQFDEITSLQSAHIGLFWQKFKKTFPDTEQKPPLSSPTFKARKVNQVEISFTPSLPRIWFFNKNNQSKLIQIQSDRFITNWRKFEEPGEYPHFNNVFSFFNEYYSKWEHFCKSNLSEELKPLSYELKYVNHIPRGQGWMDFSDLSKIFPFFQFPKKNTGLKPQFLSHQDFFSVQDFSGIIQTSIKTAKLISTKEDLIVFEIGIRVDLTEVDDKFDLSDSFKESHNVLLKAFLDLTSTYAQSKIWVRSDTKQENN